jgi:hypothetical protein
MTTPQITAKTATVKFAPAEKERLKIAAAELTRLDSLLEQVIDLKAAIADAGSRFVAGEISIIEICGLVCADSTDRHELQQALKPHVKNAMRNTVGSVGDLIEKARQFHIDELAAKASNLEKLERATLTDLGINQDEYQPSSILAGLREQHRRTLTHGKNTVSRAELNILIDGL